MKLNEKQRQRIQARHQYSVDRYGTEPGALFWSSRAIQELRFQILLNAMVMFSGELNIQPSTVLDVGCGFGDLRAYALKQDLVFEYLGIDVSQSVVEAGRQKYVGIQLEVGEIFDFDFADNQFDWVLLSGALNEVVDETGDYALGVIEKMFQIAKYGVAFNLLNQEDAWLASRKDLQSFMPQTILAFCQTLTPQVTLINDYLPNDFTLVLLKDKGH